MAVKKHRKNTCVLNSQICRKLRHKDDSRPGQITRDTRPCKLRRFWKICQICRKLRHIRIKALGLVDHDNYDVFDKNAVGTYVNYDILKIMAFGYHVNYDVFEKCCSKTMYFPMYLKRVNLNVGFFIVFYSKFETRNSLPRCRPW